MSDKRFIPYSQHQDMLLPPSLDEMVPKDSMARIVSDVIDVIDTSTLLDLYPGGGRSAYHPVMLLKVVTYAYASGIYSSRKIAQASRESIHFLWLSGQTPLDHNTINRFRSKRIAPLFESIFSEVVLLLAQNGHLDLDTYFLDGTKIEANASKYSSTWKKNTERYGKRLREQVANHLGEIDKLNEEEETLLGDREPEDISSDDIKQAARRINDRLKKNPKDTELKRTSKKMEKDWIPRLKKYEQQTKTFGDDRNSYSKTDTCATFMRMKDDHMRNGQLKAGYNAQIGTNNQFILSYSLHNNRSDVGTLISHLDNFKNHFNILPKQICADAGYGSEENYCHLEQQNIKAFIKYPLFHKEQKKKFKSNLYRQENFIYNKKKDSYTCPEGRELFFDCEKTVRTATGYPTKSRIYHCSDCTNCSKLELCVQKGGSKRTLSINSERIRCQQKARNLLLSEEGLKLRSQRPIEAESVFGNIKQNMGFRRFSLKGMQKVSLEWGWISLGHNMRKLHLAMGG